MMKNFILIFLFSNTIIAQERFNKSYSFQQKAIEATSSVELNDGYLISEKIIQQGDSSVALGIRKLDFQGNSVWYKIFSYPGKQIIPSKNAMHLNANSDVWISCTYSDSLITGNPSDGLWMKINSNGDSLTSFTFGGINSDRVYNSILDNDGNLVCAGAKYIAVNRDNPWAIKFDQNGNLIWENQPSNSSFTRHFETIAQNVEGDYIFAGMIKQTGENILRSKIKYDGSTVWIKPTSISNMQNGRATGLVTFQDNILITGNDWSGPNNLVSYNFYDTTGNFIDYRQFGGGFLKYNLYTNPIIVDSSNYTVAGRTQKHAGDSAYWGWFISYQYPDSMIWDRTYHYNSSSNHLFSDLKRTSDGGFILCGFNKNDSLNVNNSWVVKLDSNGCEMPGCELLSIKANQNRDLKISISPNPANSFINVKCNVAGDKMIVQLFNIEGLLLKEWRNVNNDRISLESYNSGLYLLRIFENNNLQKLEHFKLIINK